MDEQNILLKRLPANGGPLASKGRGLPEQWIEAGSGTQNVLQALPQQRGHKFKPTSEGATDLPTAARSYLGVRLHLHPSDLAEKDGVGETPLSSKSSLSPERFDSNSTADL